MNIKLQFLEIIRKLEIINLKKKMENLQLCDTQRGIKLVFPELNEFFTL